MAATTRKSATTTTSATAPVSKNTTTSITYNATIMLLFYSVIISFVTSQFLSVDAIRCHQCNSHLDEDCTNLRLSTPRAPRDDQFLKECEAQHDAQAFCRKTVLTIEVTGEHRIIRGCGWIRDAAEIGNNSCFNADNEGYKQLICACNKDGCNGSSGLIAHKWSILFIAVVLALVLRRN